MGFGGSTFLANAKGCWVGYRANSLATTLDIRYGVVESIIQILADLPN